jgi:diguanylate cyclase (GGDEF)-like protein/PAS domain S-box-containing protein
VLNKNILTSKTILYVEDDENTREEIAFFLEKFALKIYIAKNGKEGLALYKKYSPDIVVTDIQMPVMNGIDMIKEIKKIDATIPTIVTTAFNETAYLLNAINIGVNRYILKPINLKKMIQEIIDLLDEYEYEPLYQSLDHNGHILDVNAEWLAFLGYELKEILGKSFKDFIDKDSLEILDDALESLKEHGSISSIKLGLKHKDGSKLEVVASATLHYTKKEGLERVEFELKNINYFKHSQNSINRVLEKERYLRGLITTYAHIGSAIAQSTSLEEFLQNVTNAFIKNSEYEHTFIAIIDQEENLAIEAQSKHEKLDISKLLGKNFSVTQNTYFPIREAFYSKNMVIVDDISKLLDFPEKKFFNSIEININAIVALPINLKVAKKYLGVLVLHFNNTPKFNKEELNLFDTISETVAFGIQAFRDKKEKEELIEMLDIQATTDALTGCINRYKGSAIGQKEVERSLRYGRKLSLLYFDIDYFKDINDTLGHEKGDVVLKESAEFAKELLRASDVIVRWGGEEFIIILPETTLESAIKIAEKLRYGFEKAEFIKGRVVTASFGVVELLKDENWDGLIKRADDLMYKAKKSGRNRVVHG